MRLTGFSAIAMLLPVVALPAMAQTMNGAIDMHAHSDPDGTPRAIDAIDLARLAKSRGMRALVLKNHYEPTASLAYIVRKEVPGIEVFGGISLDLTVGGVNPAAVEWMTKVKGGYGRVVWLPTFDSEAQVKRRNQQRPFARVAKDGKVGARGCAGNRDRGEEQPGARNRAFFGSRESCFSSRRPSGRECKHVMVTHALTNPGGPLTLAEIQEAAKMGASIELVYSPFNDAQLQKDVEAIRAVGVGSVVLSSDLGQPTNPLHPDGLLALYKGLVAHGLTVAEVDQMSKANPAKLLGLKP